MHLTKPVESSEDFKAVIAPIIGGDKREQIKGGPRPHPLLVRSKKRATQVRPRK